MGGLLMTIADLIIATIICTVIAVLSYLKNRKS